MSKDKNTRLINNSVFAKNLQIYLNINDKKQIDLVRDLGFSSSTVSNWLNARMIPRRNTLEMLANYLNISTNDLLFDTLTLSELKQSDLIKIPIYSNITSLNLKENNSFISEYLQIATNEYESGVKFAVLAPNDTMEPLIQKHDILLVKVGLVPNNEIALIMLDKKEIMVTRINQTSDGLTLIPVNPNYRPSYYTNAQIAVIPVVIIGKIVESRRQHNKK